MEVDEKDLKIFAKFWFECGWECHNVGFPRKERFEFHWKNENNFKQIIKVQKIWEGLRK